MDEDEEVDLTLEEASAELNRLVLRIRSSEDFIDRAEAFYREKNEEWPCSVAARIEIFLERKREQTQNEEHLAHKMGMDIARGRYPRALDS